MSKLEIKGASFVIDGQERRILSGAMHYFRVRPELWRDRLRKLKLMGLDTVETYVAWNLHEPRPGVFDFSGALDVKSYLQIAQEEGLHAILRPGPYMCSEWDFGGLPWWLLQIPSIRLRCMDEAYLAATKRFFKALLKEVKPTLSSKGGPVMMVQVENEYGSYGSDSEYLGWIAATLKALGVDVPLFTSDGPCDWMLNGGTIPDVLKTANFGSRAQEAFETLERHQPGKPHMCAEFWNGWFDHWGEKRHVRDPQDATAALEEILAAGGSVNLYMFHGGTSHGFNNGANCANGVYQPTIGSYDDDAPLDEAGDPTPKYHAFRKLLAKYADVPDAPVPGPAPKKAYGKVELTESASLLDSLDVLSVPIHSQTPEPMECFDQGYGFILYRSRLKGPHKDAELSVIGLADRAVVFVDGVRKGVLSRIGDAERTLVFDIPPEGVTVELLVENMGRINYGVELADRKGITGGVVLSKQQFVYDWTVFPLPLDNLSQLKFAKPTAQAPAFHRGHLKIEGAPVDTFLSMEGWGKGVCWLNGFNLGRHWKIGPQMTHFIPACLLRKGRNEIVVLELEAAKGSVEFLDHSILDGGATST